MEVMVTSGSFLHEVERLLDGSQLLGIVTEILHDIPLVDAEVEISAEPFSCLIFTASAFGC